MKSVHTQPSSRNLNVIHDKFEIPQRILQDMSVCDISVDTELDTNKELLSAMKTCTECIFEASDKNKLEEHLQNTHGQSSDINLSERIIETPQSVGSSSVYNCDECTFTPTIAESLKEHKEDKHNTVNVLNVEHIEHLLADVSPDPESGSLDMVPEIPDEIIVQDPMMEKAKASYHECHFLSVQNNKSR